MSTTHERQMPAVQELVTPEEIHVINLRRSSERWARFNASARRHNVNFRRFEATNAHCLRYEEHDNDTLVVTDLNDASVIFHVHRDALTRRIINLADIACAVSHARLWTTFLRSGNELLAVLEDDALVQRPLEFHPLPEDADIVFFGSRVDAFMPSDDDDETPSENWLQENKFARVANVRGMEGYLLRKSGARKMLHAVRTMRLPLDMQVTLDCCEAPPSSDSDLSRPSLQSPGISAHVTTEVFAFHDDSALNLTSENRGVRRLRWKNHACPPLNAADSKEDTRSGGIQSLNPEPSTGSTEFTGSTVINGLWIGKELPPIARLSIMSYQAGGYPFRLFTYDEVKGVPKNTIVADASLIMPYKELLLQPGGGDAHASELFRYILLEEQGGCWTDLDVICLKERPPLSRPWFALQDQAQAGIGFLAFPPKHPVIACMADCAYDPGRRTPWDDIETICAKIKNCYRHPALRERREAARRARWAYGGTDEFTRCLKFHGLFNAAAPPESLYPVHGTEWKRLYDGTLRLGDVAGESTWGIHLWGENLRNEPHVLQTMDDSSVVASLARRFAGIPARDWLQCNDTGLKNKPGSPADRKASGSREKLSNTTHHGSGGIDFLEVGAACFDTLPRSLGKTGITVEPVRRYHRLLPNVAGWTNVRAAIGEVDRHTFVYSLSIEDIVEYALPDWVRGCNTLDAPHPTVLNLLHERDLNGRFVADRTRVYSLECFLSEFGLEHIANIKTDTEGCDATIALQYIEMLTRGILKEPAETYQLESLFMSEDDVQSLISKFLNCGYSAERGDSDIYFKLS